MNDGGDLLATLNPESLGPRVGPHSPFLGCKVPLYIKPLETNKGTLFSAQVTLCYPLGLDKDLARFVVWSRPLCKCCGVGPAYTGAPTWRSCAKLFASWCHWLSCAWISVGTLFFVVRVRFLPIWYLNHSTCVCKPFGPKRKALGPTMLLLRYLLALATAMLDLQDTRWGIHQTLPIVTPALLERGVCPSYWRICLLQRYGNVKMGVPRLVASPVPLQGIFLAHPSQYKPCTQTLTSHHGARFSTIEGL